MAKVKAIFNRIYADYLMHSRLKEYEKIIQSVLKEGFVFITYRDYVQGFRSNSLSKSEKYFILRHDIDTDVRTAKQFFRIEKKLNVKASYYFRQATMDITFMKAINDYGSEASYHFEEIASFCKKNHIKTREEAIANIKEIKFLFKNNLQKLESQLGFKIKTVAAHGDFVNRKLKIINNYITDDRMLRQELGILAETYDQDVFDSFDVYISDKPYPVYYTKSVSEHIKKDKIICFLTHPRHWHTNFYVNTKDNIRRLVEGILW